MLSVSMPNGKFSKTLDIAIFKARILAAAANTLICSALYWLGTSSEICSSVIVLAVRISEKSCSWMLPGVIDAAEDSGNGDAVALVGFVAFKMDFGADCD